MILNFIIYLSVSLGIGCNKEIPPTPIPIPPTPIPIPPTPCLYGLCDTSKLNLVWQVPLSKDTAEIGSKKALLFNGNVLFTEEQASETLNMLDGKTGAFVWNWSDYIVNGRTSITGNGAGANGIIHKDNQILINAWNEIYSMNAQDGRTTWKYQTPFNIEGHPRFKIIGEELYHVHEPVINKKTVKSTLVKSRINQAIWNPVFSQDSFGKYEPSLETPNKWISPEGHEILIFQARFIDFSFSNNSPDLIDVVGYDTQDKKEYFRFKNIDSLNMSGSTKTAFILNNKAYMPLQNRIVCIDLLSKSILWYKKMNPGVGFSSGNPFIFVENKLFLKPDDRVLYQINPDTGAEIWVDKDNGSGCSDMVYHKGLLYYTCSGNGKIYAVEVATGKKIWAEPSPNKFPNAMNGNRRRSNANIGSGGVAKDSTLGYLYTSDYYFGICLKLPK